MTRIEHIIQAGYLVKVIWECEFDASKIVERKPELLIHPIVRHTPLYTRDSLYGCRTAASGERINPVLRYNEPVSLHN